MKKNTFMVVSGFLGAGKTTSMIALSEHINAGRGKAAIIANDLGAKHLVDRGFTAAAGCRVEEISGDCICYQTENLADKLKRLRDEENVALVMSDIPGCGIGALDHVYHALHRRYGEHFDLAPFLVVVDPERLRMIRPERAGLNLPKEMAFLLKAQIAEADVVALNKIDLLSEEDIRKNLEFLREISPETPVFAISAKERRNIGELAEYILTHSASLKNPDIGYGGEEFVAAESLLSWYNRQFHVRSADGTTFDGNDFMTAFIEEARSGLKEAGRNVPHLKVSASGGNSDFGKFSLLGTDYEIEKDRSLRERVTGCRVIVNARAVCESRRLDAIMDAALREAASRFNLGYQVFFTECFGMMDEGKL